MDQPSILSVALANLTKSHDFLLKLLDACGKLPGAPGTASDREMMAAISHLARLTRDIVRDGELARNGRSDFVAARTLSQPAVTNESSPDGNEARRLHVILDMCVQQSERTWRHAVALESENAALRAELKLVAADMVAARAALTSGKPG